MRLIIFLLSALVLTGAAEAARPGQDSPLAGGYREQSVTDADVLAAARFAVREATLREGRRVTLLAVRQAETQVVAGFNYRLTLSVRSGGREGEARAVVHRSLKNAYRLTAWERQGGRGASRPATREVKVYLVAVGDAGRRGRKVGCDDSLVPVTRNVRADGEPLKAAITELLSMPRESEGGLGNYWQGDNLRVRSASVSGGTATIRISGRVHVAGVCDQPRIEEQIKETARQFPGVRRVRVFVNGRALSRAIS